MQKQPKEIVHHILTIGPEYRNHRGGIGAVLEIYSRYFEVFNFISSYKEGNWLIKSIEYFICLFNYFAILIQNKQIKIIHIHGASNGSFYRKYFLFIIAKKVFKKKVIYHLHGGGFENFHKASSSFVKTRIKYLVENVDTVICLSEKWRVFFDQNFKCKKLKIIPNIIDYPLKIENKNENNDKIRLLFLGLICNNKGIFDLLNVIINDKDYYKDKIILYIGGNGERERLLEIIEKHSLQGTVEYIGWVTSEVKAKYLIKCNVYILPSYIEGLPISILEAMSYAKPIISTNVGGIPEIVIPGKNGFLLEPGDLNGIERTIKYCIENKEVLLKYGDESKKIVEKHLPQKVIKELFDIYQELLKT